MFFNYFLVYYKLFLRKNSKIEELVILENETFYNNLKFKMEAGKKLINIKNITLFKIYIS